MPVISGCNPDDVGAQVIPALFLGQTDGGLAFEKVVAAMSSIPTP